MYGSIVNCRKKYGPISQPAYTCLKVNNRNFGVNKV